MTGISIRVGTPAFVNITEQLPQAVASYSEIYLNITPTGPVPEDEYFGPAFADYVEPIGTVPPGGSTATVTAVLTLGASYEISASFLPDELVDWNSTKEDGSQSGSSAGSITVDSLAAGNLTLNLKPLKWRKLAGSVTNAKPGSGSIVVKSDCADSYISPPTIACTGNTYHFGALALEGSHVVDAYEILDKTKLKGNLFGWYGSSNLTQPAPFSLNADLTNMK